MADNNSIFRKVSLERMSSPEQLDQKLTVISPVGWMAVVSLAVLIFAALIWGFWGTVSNKVYGSGVLTYGDGIAKITSHTEGQITSINVHAGDYVEKGYPIARVSQESLKRKIEQTQDNLAALESVSVETLDLDIEKLNYDLYSVFAPLASSIRSARVQYDAQRDDAFKNEHDLDDQRVIQTQQISTLESQIKMLEAQIKEYESLLGYQQEVDLENAMSQYRLQTANDKPSALEQLRKRPNYDSNLATMENQLKNYQLQETSLTQQIETLENQKEQYIGFLDYQKRIDLENAEAQDRQRVADGSAPKLAQQVQNRPDYDAALAQMQSQLTQLKTDRDRVKNRSNYDPTLIQMESQLRQSKTDSDKVKNQSDYDPTLIQMESQLEQLYADRSMTQSSQSSSSFDLTLAQLQSQLDQYTTEKNNFILLHEEDEGNYDLETQLKLNQMEQQVSLLESQIRDYEDALARQQTIELGNIETKLNLIDRQTTILEKQIKDYKEEKNKNTTEQLETMDQQIASLEQQINDYMGEEDKYAEEQLIILNQQITSLETQIGEYKELITYQHTIELENAQDQDKAQARQQENSEDHPNLADQVRTRPDYDSSLSAMQSQLESLQIQKQTLSLQITSLTQQIEEYEGYLVYQLQIELENAQAQDRQSAAARDVPNAVEQIKNRPNYDPNLSSMQSQLVDYRMQLIQAQTRNNQLNATFTNFLWGAYNQTGDQILSLAEQCVHLKQVKHQDYLNELKDLQDDYAKKSVITAEFSGVVSDLNIQPYDYVQLGSVQGNIVRGDRDVISTNVILYVPIDKGKLVQDDMEVSISPATVNREEHGYIIGKVISVSEAAVTQEHMMNILQNMQLVNMFARETAVLQVEVELLRNDETISGFQWSTPRGAPLLIKAGTICYGEITVSTRQPIELVVPFIKGLFR